MSPCYRIPCPRCGTLRLMSAREWNGLVACDQTRCGHVFHAPAAPPRRGPQAVPPPFTDHKQPRETRLTRPHYCFTCQGDLPQPTGYRRGGIRHRRPNADGEAACLTAAYAEIYTCPSCGTLLETPSRFCGQAVQCPHCGREHRAPVFHLLHEVVGDHIEGEPFRFHCPACRGLLQCDTHRGGQPTAGEPVACLHCSAVVTIPSVGEAVGR